MKGIKEIRINKPVPQGPKEHQVFQPIGGSSINPLSSPHASWKAITTKIAFGVSVIFTIEAKMSIEL